jgi:hypothetical protein
MVNNINTQGKPDPRKVYAVNKKLNKIILSLHPLEEGFSKSTSLQKNFRQKIVHQPEEQFADEITALYYFHLYFEYELKQESVSLQNIILPSTMMEVNSRFTRSLKVVYCQFCRTIKRNLCWVNGYLNGCKILVVYKRNCMRL